MTTAIAQYRPGILERLMAPRAETSTLSKPAQWLIDALVGEKTLAGANVNARTALGLSAYFACIRNISEDVGKLPRFTYRRTPNGRERVPDHPTYRLVHDEPNPEMSSMEFHETLMSHALGWRGGFAEIVRDTGGTPRQLWLLDPNTVCVERESRGGLRYVVRTPGMQPVTLTPDRIIHIHGLGFDGITGYAMAWIARESLGAAIAARDFTASFFGNGTKASGILEVPAGFSEKAMENLRASFKERYEGRENMHKTVLLEDGVKYVPTSTDPQKSQMIETMEWHVADVCRWFRFPPSKLGQLTRAQGWSTLEMTNTDYVVDCLTPWITRIEQEYQRKLFQPRERDTLYVKMMVAGLMRGDSQTRAAFYREGLMNGWLQINDVREMEDLNYVEGGWTTFVPLNMQTLDRAIAGPPEDENTPPAEPNEPEAEPEPQDSRLSLVFSIARAHESLLADSLSRVLKTEGDFVRRMSKKQDGAKRIEQFYADHQQHVIAAIGGQIEAFVHAGYAALTGKTPNGTTHETVFALVKAQAEQHVRISMHEMADAAAVEKWESGERAKLKSADMMNALVEMVMDLAGDVK